MIGATSAGFLAAGAVFAALPLVLHLLSRRPPERQPLPTARFLREDRRTLLRLTRRPADIPVLVVRMLFAIVLGAAFAGITWTAERTEKAALVLVDVEAAAEVGSEALVAAVAEAIAAAEGAGATPRVLAYARAPDGALVTSPTVEELFGAVGAPVATASDGLSALRSAVAADADIDSVTVAWVVRPTWRLWTPGIGLLREALWPGAITLHPVGVGRVDVGEPAPPSPEGDETPAVVHTIGFGPGSPLHRAATALGWEPVETGTPPRDGARLLFAADAGADELDALISTARAGATVVLTGTLPSSASGTDVPWVAEGPWMQGARTGGAPAGILRPGRSPLPFSTPPAEGRPASGARVAAVAEDGRPLAARRTLGPGCLVYSAVSLNDEQLATLPGYVDLIDDLAGACPGMRADVALDPGATTALSRPDLPGTTGWTDLGAPSGTPLTPLLLGLALFLLATEVALTRRKDA